MRALPQKAGTPRGARPSPRAHARSFARSRRPEASPPALRVGATPARARVVSGRPEWPGSLGSRPPPPPPGSQPTRPSLSSRNGAGAARGRASWTRLALGLALSAAAWLAPPCAFPQSVAPKAPLSGGRGSCFRFFLSLQSGVASSTPAPLPLCRRGQLQLKAAAVATGDGADRLAPASGKGALGSRAPRAGDSRTGRARALRSPGSGRTFVLPPIPGLLLQVLQLLLSQRPGEKWGGSLRDAPACLGPLGEGRRGVGHPRTRGMGAGWEASLCEPLHLPLLAPAAGSPWSEHGKVGSFALLCGLLGMEIGVNLHKDAFWRVAEAEQ